MTQMGVLIMDQFWIDLSLSLLSKDGAQHREAQQRSESYFSIPGSSAQRIYVFT